ncbi:Transcription factor Sp1 [Mycena kentingensis (nom. inval.)]|nr:Transcription factor Sp1 [Mycena kentingensis (nom. inval.)]
MPPPVPDYSRYWPEQRPSSLQLSPFVCLPDYSTPSYTSTFASPPFAPLSTLLRAPDSYIRTTWTPEPPSTSQSPPSLPDLHHLLSYRSPGPVSPRKTTPFSWPGYYVPSRHLQHTDVPYSDSDDDIPSPRSPVPQTQNSAPMAESKRFSGPVRNAHRGVSQGELEARFAQETAEDVDGAWFSQFYGQMATDGRKVAEWNCYILGCSQTNKRRDHMHTHIKGHLDQRPFQCKQCSASFLRNHELKRHSSSHHQDARPFACRLCTVSYRRRDMLVRHIRQKHGKEGKENYPSSKRARKS